MGHGPAGELLGFPAFILVLLQRRGAKQWAENGEGLLLDEKWPPCDAKELRG